MNLLGKGCRKTCVLTLLFFQGFAILGVGMFAFAIRKAAEPEDRNM